MRVSVHAIPWSSKLAALVLLLWSTGAWAQSLNNYTFAASAGTFAYLTGATNPTLTRGTIDDGSYNSLPIGFTFIYNGLPYTTLSANTNGWMTLGQDAGLISGESNNLTNGLAPRPVIAPLWDDIMLTATTGFNYLTTGTAGSRIFTAEWKLVEWNFNATAATISFQARLYEASGKVEFIYKQEPGTFVSNTGGASIGLAAVGTGSGNFRSLTATTAAATASSTSETMLNTRPATGQIFAFKPPVAPTAPTNLTFASVTGNSLTLNFTDNSATEVGFLVERSTDNVTFATVATLAANTTTLAQTGLTPGTAYYYRVSALSEGTKSAALTGSQTTGAVIAVSPGSLSFGAATTSGSAGTRTFTVGGTGLTANIVLTPSKTTIQFRNATSGGSFSSTPITLSRTNGTVATQTIEVRLVATLPQGAYNEQIDVVSGAASAVVSVTASNNSGRISDISVSTTGTDFTFVTRPNTISASKSFYVAATNLLQPLVVAPTGTNAGYFEVSKDNVNFFTSISFTPDGQGNLAQELVYIHFVPGLNAVTVTANISNSSSPAPISDVSVTGTSFTVCAPQAIAQNATVQLDATGNATITAATVNNGSTANCGFAADGGLRVSPSSFTCAQLGPNAVTLTVTDADGNVSTAPATLTVTASPTATIGSLSPAAAAAGASVTVSGTHLGGATALTVNGVSVAIRDLKATGFSFVVPADAAQTGNVAVSLPCGQGVTAAFAVLPTLSSFTPASGPVGTRVTITGTHLTGATALAFAGSSGHVVSTGFTVASASSITGVVVPAGAVSGTLTVSTPAGTSAASAQSFTVTPSLSSLSLSAGSLSPAFAPATTSYAFSVPFATTSTTATPTNAQTLGGTITVNGTPVASGSTSGIVSLAVGDNTVTVAVNPAGTGPATLYAVTVTRLPCAVTVLSASSIAVAPATTVNTGGVPTNLYLGYGPQSVTLRALHDGTSYAWIGPKGLSSTTTAAPVFTATEAGSFTYQVTITQQNGCAFTASVTLRVQDVRCGSKNDKVLVCHGGKALCIVRSDVASHVSHGDALGTCPPASTRPLAARSAPEATRPSRFEAFPNPFNESTTLRFRVERTVPAQLRVYNALGQLVTTLFDQEAQAGQEYETRLAGRDLAQGLYTCRLQLGDRLLSQRVMLTK